MKNNYEAFLSKIEQQDYTLKIKSEKSSISSAEVLFHTPLLSLAILVVAFSKTDKFTVENVSSYCGFVLARNFFAYKNKSNNLEWSLTIKIRCADALLFLESADLISIDKYEIEITKKGKKFISDSLKISNDYGTLVRGLKRAAALFETTEYTLL